MDNIKEKEEGAVSGKHIRMYDVPNVEIGKRTCYNLFKRVLDVLLTVIALVICLLPMLAISVAIMLDSRGGIFYKQERLGKDGKPFMLYKFRSMRPDAENAGAQWAEENDVRCTKIGAFLRKSRLDELPQFFNILKGDMSIVGPRPERPYFYGEFEKRIHGFINRTKVIPGLTGLAQVNGGYDLLPEEKIVYDMEYIEKASLLLDIKCIIKTVAILFNHNGAR